MSLLDYATALIALGMLCLSSSHFAAVGWRIARSGIRAGGVRLRQQAQLRRESQHARLTSELSWQTPTDLPNAWRVVEVVEIVDESVDCRSFYLRDPLGGALPGFLPGQFIMVRPALGGASQPTRCYSLSDAPGQPWWRITVKRTPTTRSVAADRSHSGLSVWLHERMGVGDCLLARGPCGEFVLDNDSSGPIVLLAAGIGITPLASMLKSALQSHPARRVHLYFQVRDEQHWPLGEVLHGWQQSCPALSVTSYFSREMPLAAPEQGGIEFGKFDAAAIIERIGNQPDATYYLCGPEVWMHGLIDDLKSLGVASHRIHFESFGAAVDRQGSLDWQDAASDSSSTEPWSLSFARSGLHLEPSTQVASIWETASVNGLELPAGCHSGACGSCRLRLISGQVGYPTQPQCSLAEGEVLACIAQPIGDVVVDA